MAPHHTAQFLSNCAAGLALVAATALILGIVGGLA